MEPYLNLFEKFISHYIELVGHLAWPSLVLIIVLIFRKQIVALLKSRIKIRHKGTEVDLNLPVQLSKTLSEPIKTPKIEPTVKVVSTDVALDIIEQWAIFSCILAAESYRMRWKGLEPLMEKLPGVPPQKARETFRGLMKFIEKYRPESGYLDALRKVDVSMKAAEQLMGRYRRLKSNRPQT